MRAVAQAGEAWAELGEREAAAAALARALECGPALKVNLWSLALCLDIVVSCQPLWVPRAEPSRAMRPLQEASFERRAWGPQEVEAGELLFRATLAAMDTALHLNQQVGGWMLWGATLLSPSLS